MLLTVLATILGLILRLNAKLVPTGLREGLVESSRIFVPVTAAVVFFFVSNMSFLEVGVVFAIMSVYALVFFTLDNKLDYYIQLRIYPLLAVIYFCIELHNLPLLFAFLFLAVLLSNTLAALLCYPIIMQRKGYDQNGAPRLEVVGHLDAALSIAAAGFTLLEATITILSHRSIDGGNVLERLLPFFESQNNGGFLPALWVLSRGPVSAVCAAARWLAYYSRIPAYRAQNRGARLPVFALLQLNRAEHANLLNIQALLNRM